MEKEVSREQFKNNFLKNIIIRCDYTGIAEIELDNIFVEVKPILKGKGYTKFKNEYSTELDLKLDDPELLETEGLPLKEIKKQKVYVFMNPEKGVVFKLSSFFAFISIENAKYIDFTQYCSTFLEILKLIREKVEFFTATRLGLRKVNQCIINNISNVNDYFECKYFNVINLDGKAETKLYQAKDCFEFHGMNTNLVRTIIRGEYENRSAYQLVLDTDIYSIKEEQIYHLLADVERMKELNEFLFSIYRDSITERFIKKLIEVPFNDENIIGVESNV